VKNQIRHAHGEKYLEQEEYEQLALLCARALGATTRLRSYLMRCPKNFDPRQGDKPDTAPPGTSEP
jgi:hypothetical protein